MKRLLATLIAASVAYCTYAQNTLPANGYVGIGTTAPLTLLDVKLATNQHIQFAPNVNGGYLGASGIVCINDANNAYTPLGFFASNYYFGNGNVGIGTTSPSTALQIGNFSSGASSNQLLIPGTYNFEQVRLGQIGNGNSALEFVNHNGVPSSYGIKFLVDVDHGASGLQIQYAPATTSYASLSYTTGLYLNLAGNVGIGTTTPDQKLTVNGTIHSKSVVVDANIFPDYVFHKDYNLPTLTEVKTYIDQNHHLPNVPSAAEVEKNGLNLGEMNKVLVQKVEELTLYLIEQNKQLKAQQQEIEQLKNRK